MNLQAIIDSVVTAQAKVSQAKRIQNKVSPSSLGKCLRQLMLMERGAPHTEFTAQQLRVFRAGYLFEEFVHNALKESGKLVDFQKTVSYRGITGTLDFIVHSDDGKDYIVDCKSVHSKKFDYLDAGEVDEGYALQQTFYWKAAVEAGVENLADKALLFYVEKECLLTKVIEVDCKKWLPILEAKIDTIELCRSKAPLLPVELEPGTSWQCYTVQKSKHKVPRPIAVKTWCQYIQNCPNCLKARDEALAMVEEVTK